MRRYKRKIRKHYRKMVRQQNRANKKLARLERRIAKAQIFVDKKKQKEIDKIS